MECDDSQECTTDTFDTAVAACVHTPLPPGAPCVASDKVCDGNQGCAPSGQALWAKRFGGSGFEQVRGLAVGSEGQIAQGKWIFGKTFGDLSEQLGRDVTFDRFGNPIVTGEHAGSIDFGGGPRTATSNGYNFFAAKLGPDGAHKWSRSFGGDKSFQIDQRVSAAGPGYLVIAGHFDDTIDFGLGQLVTARSNDIVVAALIP